MSRDDDVIDVQAVDRSRPASGASGVADATDGPDESLKTWGWVSYILHLIVAVSAVVPGAQVSIALLIVAQVMDLVKRSDALGTWQASHFRWRIHSVLWAGVLYVVTLPLWLLFIGPGWVAWALISIWFLYRIVSGMVRMSAGRPIGEQGAP